MKYSHWLHQDFLFPEVLMKVHRILKLLNNSYVLLDVNFAMTIF